MTNRERLIRLAKLFNIRDFFETGTQGGHLFRDVQGHFDRAFTIELADGQAPGLVAEFAGSDRVFLFTGSSGDRLGELLKEHKITRALFWLDAHGNETFFVDDGKNQVPKELAAIAQYAPDSLVVIDDVIFQNSRHWNGKNWTGVGSKFKHWLNTSYEFVVPEGWEVKYLDREAILHRGGYALPENL